ncbi:LacI family DNA-binding transcriptional regulator [Demequina aestuarii]|uniref:LacI family DNA-binding transcriptional regulator n=1 Tax=Demequina aestuarii TaxID=327095 RepID=UPI000781756C|nr:LacI family DNA-binding transcriptional regulator [Demequina aestuarii]
MSTLPPGASAPRVRIAPSQADVARLAGVSGQTVSRVANGSESVLPATRQRVLDAMNTLGYSPNSAARALRNGTFDTLGIIVHKLARTGESRTVDAIVTAAHQARHTVTLVDVESPSTDEVTAAATRLSHQAIDGLIIIRAELERTADLALPADLPVVVSDSQFMGQLPSVGSDQISGTRRAVEHLLSLGHQTVHLLAGPQDSVPAGTRRRAWADTLAAHDRPIPAPLQGDWTAESGYAAGRAVADDPSITAVFSSNDEMAAGLYLALHEQGVRVPDDVSIVGFDDVPLATYLWPPLTTVRQDFGAIGKELVASLLTQMAGEAPARDALTLIPTELIVRRSTAPPRRRP